MTSLKRIIFHWTGGTYTPNDTDKEAYHFIIDGDGEVVKGKYDPKDNLNCKDGKYAKHCGGGNTGSIGIAIGAMWDARQYPIKRKQIEAACKLAAELCNLYGIRITNTTVLTHSEFGEAHPSSLSYGKIDIDDLPCIPVYGRKFTGDWIRKTTRWYRSKIK